MGTAAPYTGNFKPQNDQLSRFDGKSRRGTWTLRVRDLFEGDVGTVRAWGVASQKALCDIDTTPPNTTIDAKPPNPSDSSTAQFSFGSNDGGAVFECRLDGAAYAPCGRTAAFGGLSIGSHTLSVRAVDGSDNQDATPATYTWQVTTPGGAGGMPAASFVVAPVEERLADALAGRFKVLAACASRCRATAKLSVSARTARRLGLGRRAVVLGSAAKLRRSAGTATVVVRLSKRARAALRGRASTTVRLRVTVSEGRAKLAVERNVTLRRSGVLRRVAKRGLRLWVACARRCALRGELSLSAREARRLGIRHRGSRRYELATGRVTGTRAPKVLALTVRRSARTTVGRARRVGALLEAVAGAAPNPVRTAKLSKTLRR